MLKLNFPFTMGISGATSTGKSRFVFTLLKNLSSVLESDDFPEKIFFHFKIYQNELFSNIESTIKNIEFKQGLPTIEQLESMGREYRKTILILDDLELPSLNSEVVKSLFSEYSHHNSIGCILIRQNLFSHGRFSRDITLNTQYNVIMKSLRDISQLTRLGSQIFGPGKGSLVTQAYHDCMKTPFSYLFIDLHSKGNPKYRLRTEIFNKDYCIIYSEI